MAQEDLSTSVLSIIAAFTSCRDVLRKIKVRCSKRTGSKAPPVPPNASELRLNRSLRRGPIDIQESYGQGFRSLGPGFAAGDSTASTELNSILLKLNTGLVDLISNFIKISDPKKARLDYEALTVLSDVSRVQASTSLRQLAQRLLSRLPPHQVTPGRANRGSAVKGRESKTANKEKERPRRRRHKAIPEGEYYSISKQDNETQIALVRPGSKTKLTLSTETATTHNSKASDPRKLTAKKLDIKTARVSDPSDVQTAEAQPTTGLMEIPSGHDMHKAVGAITASKVQAGLPPIHFHVYEYTPGPTAETARTAQSIPRRRPVINTETMYTAATGSTNLGEIPMHKWPQPFDYAEADRLNAIAETTNWVNTQDHPGRKKLGLMKRLFGRRQAQVIA